MDNGIYRTMYRSIYTPLYTTRLARATGIQLFDLLKLRRQPSRQQSERRYESDNGMIGQNNTELYESDNSEDTGNVRETSSLRDREPA